jgi:hypothetical protein
MHLISWIHRRGSKQSLSSQDSPVDLHWFTNEKNVLMLNAGTLGVKIPGVPY